MHKKVVDVAQRPPREHEVINYACTLKEVQTKLQIKRNQAH